MMRTIPFPISAAGSKENPTKFPQAEVDHFIKETVRWMHATPYLERYAWHDSGKGTSALFDEHGALTATGIVYAAAK